MRKKPMFDSQSSPPTAQHTKLEIKLKTSAQQLSKALSKGAMVSSKSYLVIQGQLAEGRDVLGPFHQDQELLLHRLTDITDTCNSLQVYVSTCTGAWG